MNKPDRRPEQLLRAAAAEHLRRLALAGKLLRATPAGALATLTRDAGYPFASLTSVATDCDGAPLLLLSGLAHHTRNLLRRRARLPAAGRGRQGRSAGASAADRASGAWPGPPTPVCARRFLRRHPKSALYVDFPDFSFWRLEPEAAHLNGGFARAADYPGADVLTGVSGAEALFAAEEGAARRGQCAVARGARQIGAGGGRGPDPHWRRRGSIRTGSISARGNWPPGSRFRGPALSAASVAGRPGGGAAGGPASE